MYTEEYAETVMNTIPSIFNEKQFKRTVLGGNELTAAPEDCLPFSVILLNRGARHYRTQVIQQLLKYRFRSILSVELSGENYELSTLSKTYPSVKFLIPLEEVTIGDMINMGMEELDTKYVLVIWNDAMFSYPSLPLKLTEKIIADERLCTVPLLTTHSGQSIPVGFMPVNEQNKFKVLSSMCYQDDIPTLYPFDYIGIYNREKFMQLGGFDYTIKTSYWQNLDFFFRSWLWGEKTAVATLFKVSYQSETPCEDITTDDYYLRFFLKNLVPQYKMDHAEVPFKKVFSFINKYPKGLLEAVHHFKDARNWVEKNKYRFKTDAKLLMESWDNEEK